MSLQRVGVERPAGRGPGRLLGERRDALGPALDGQVVDAGLVEDRGEQRHRRCGRGDQLGVLLGVGPDRLADRVLARRHDGLTQRRGDDDAGLVVAVGGDPVGVLVGVPRDVGADAPRRPGPRPRGARSCGSATDDVGAQRRPGLVGRDDALDEPDQPEQLGAQQVEVAARLGLVLQRLVEAEQRHGRGVRVDLEAGRVDLEAEPLADPGAAGAVRELGLAGVGRVGARPRTCGSRGSAPAPPVGTRSALVTTSGASIPATQSGPRYGARAASISSSVRTVRDVEQPGVGVQHREPGGLLVPPGEVDAQVGRQASGTTYCPDAPSPRGRRAELAVPRARRRRRAAPG